MAAPPFQSFLDEHRDPVLGFLRAMVGPVDADDCFQETVIAALRAYPRLSHEDNLRGWLLTIAHRKATDIAFVGQGVSALMNDRASDAASGSPPRTRSSRSAQTRRPTPSSSARGPRSSRS